MNKQNEKNQIWTVYNKNGRVIAISKDKITAQQEALKQSRYRWTFQTFTKDFKYLLKDGYTISKSKITPLDK